MTGTILAIIVVIVIFIVGRELLCWYWKINKMVEITRKIGMELKKQNETLEEIAESLKKE